MKDRDISCEPSRRGFLWIFSKTPLTYMLTIFFISSTIAFFIPVASLYLSEKLHASEFKIGLFFTVQCLFSILIGMAVAKYSDITGRRIRVICIGCICGALGCLSYAFIPEYWFLITLVNLIMGFTGVSNQLFASAREYCENTGRNTLTFTSILRVFFASAWIFGPPIAMFLLQNTSFATVFISCAAVYLLSLVLSVMFLPPDRKQERNNEVADIRLFSDKSVVFLAISTVLIFTCNYMYLIAMPQQVTKVLGFETKYVGIFMATAAACEIPCMIVFSQLAKKISMKYILLFTCVAGSVFYVTVGFSESLTMIWISQLANAIFIGNITTLGMYYFQELLPKVPGQATTLFSNSVAAGGIFSGLICGSVAQAFSYAAVFYLAAVFSLLAFGFILLVRKVD